MPTPRKLSTEREEELACRLENGESPKELALAYGVSAAYVRGMQRTRLKWSDNEGQLVVCRTELGEVMFVIKNGHRYFVRAAS